MFATVRNRRAVISAVEPFDGQGGRLHLVHVEYFDAFRTAIRKLINSGAAGRRRAGSFAVEILGKRLLSCPTALAESWRRCKEGRQRRILLTNVKQLELLLTRQVDVELFESPQLDFLVFDEAHTFTEAQGPEAACLIRRLRPGMFVAQVVGKSMEPYIPDGSYCLFAAPVTGTRQGRTVVVELDDSTDPETGERYTVKRYQSEKIASEDGTWRHIKIILKPNNPDFQPIELTCEDEGRVRVVAELLEVLE